MGLRSALASHFARRGVGLRGWLRVGEGFGSAAAATGCLIWVAGCQSSFVFAPSSAVPVSRVSPVNGSPIQHIVIIMQENRSFDNLFNGFPGADTVHSGRQRREDSSARAHRAGRFARPRPLPCRLVARLGPGQHGRLCAGSAQSSTLPYSYVPTERCEALLDLARQYTHRRSHVPVQYRTQLCGAPVHDCRPVRRCGRESHRQRVGLRRRSRYDGCR